MDSLALLDSLVIVQLEYIGIPFIRYRSTVDPGDAVNVPQSR